MSEPVDAGASTPEESAEQVIDTIDEAGELRGNIDVGEHVEEVSLEEASDDELVEVLSDDDASEEEVLEAKEEMAKRLSLKINGQEKEFDLGSDSDIESLREMAQKGEGADQKFQEAAKIRKQMESFLEILQKDPIAALRKLGHDPDSIAETHMQKRIEDMQKSPEQKELEELRTAIEEEKQLREELEKEKFDAKQQRVQDEYSRQLDTEITSSLEDSQLPKSPYVVKRLAEALMIGLEKDPNVSVADILPMVEKGIKKEIKEMFGAMPEELIEGFLGDDVSKKLRKRRISKMKKPIETASDVKATGASEIKAAQATKKAEKPVLAKDFFKNFGSN